MNNQEIKKLLENKVRELGKGQQSLIKSRRKWKNRYYKERRNVKELEEREKKVRCECYEVQIKALQKGEKDLMIQYHFAEEILNLLGG